MKYIKLFENFDPKSELYREVTSPKVISKLAELSNYLQSTDVYGLSIQGHLSAPPSGWTSNQWPINLQYANYNSTKGAESSINFNSKPHVQTNHYMEKTPHILINKNTIFDEYKEDVYINKGLTGRPETLKKGLYLHSDPNDLPNYIHPIISQACGIDPKLNELVKDLITCIKEEELIPWTDSLIEK
jgi:hypothetical protein